MRAINKTDIEIGETDISVSIYSAVEQETRFKQISECCKASVNYKRVCSNCGKELDWSEIKKAVDVGELKEVNTELIKTENGNLKILGLAEDDEEAGYFKDGTVWFIGIQIDKKNKRKTERNLIKYRYLVESLKESKKSLLGIISVRGKEHLIEIKPYFKGLIGLGIYFFDRIRDIREIAGYGLECEIDKNLVKQMSEKIKSKEVINLKNIENKREKLIEKAIEGEIKEEKEEINPIELVNF